MRARAHVLVCVSSNHALRRKNNCIQYVCMICIHMYSHRKNMECRQLAMFHGVPRHAVTNKKSLFFARFMCCLLVSSVPIDKKRQHPYSGVCVCGVRSGDVSEQKAHTTQPQPGKTATTRPKGRRRQISTETIQSFLPRKHAFKGMVPYEKGTASTLLEGIYCNAVLKWGTQQY